MHIESLIKKSHDMAKANGFWDEDRNVPEMLMLIVSELSEGLEALRKDRYAEKSVMHDLHADIVFNSIDEEFHYSSETWKELFEKNVKNSFEDELADTAIRLFDLCGGMGIDLARHIETKMHYNSTRGYKHGKKF